MLAKFSKALVLVSVIVTIVYLLYAYYDSQISITSPFQSSFAQVLSSPTPTSASSSKKVCSSKLFPAIDVEQNCPVQDYLMNDYAKMHKRALENPKGHKFLVYVCKSGCGGWGDRLKGIFLAFTISLLTDRVFLIDHSNPVDLTTSLIPNRIDWHRLNVTNYDGFKRAGQQVFDQPEWYRELLLNSTMEFEGADVVLLCSNLNLIEWVMMNPYFETKRNQVFKHTHPRLLMGCFFEYLFTPSDYLSEKVVEIKRESNILCAEAVIGIQIRAGLGVNEIADRFTTDARFFVNCAHNISRSYLQHKKVRFYVTSDTDSVKQAAYELDPKHVGIANVTATHIDQADVYKAMAPRQQVYEFVTVIAEFIVLSTADYMVTTYSGFGQLAAVSGHVLRLKHGLSCELAPKLNFDSGYPSKED